MRKPYFSVILPIFNVENYLERCIESVLSQNFTDYEVILVDDGSTDNSSRICDEYAGKYGFIKVIHKVNNGLSSARNAGLDMSSGKYILWFDSDDWVEKNTLSLIRNSIGKKEPDVVKFNYVRHIEKGIVVCKSNSKPGWYKGKEKIDKLIKLAFRTAGNYGLSACMHAYRIDFLKKSKLAFVSEKKVGSEDFLFNLEVLLCADEILILPNALYHYELRVGSLTQQYRDKLPEKYTNLFIILRDILSRQDNSEGYMKELYHFYIWILMYGTCLVNEYNVIDDHSMTEGRRNIKKYFAFPELQEAIKRCDKDILSWKQRFLLLAMKLKIECIFYWLFNRKRK